MQGSRGRGSGRRLSDTPQQFKLCTLATRERAAVVVVLCKKLLSECRDGWCLGGVGSRVGRHARRRISAAAAVAAAAIGAATSAAAPAVAKVELG